MSTLFKLIISVIGAPVLGVAIVMAVCRVPGIAFSWACGHNAGMWLFLTIPLGGIICWITLSAVARFFQKPGQPDPDANDA